MIGQYYDDIGQSEKEEIYWGAKETSIYKTKLREARENAID